MPDRDQFRSLPRGWRPAARSLIAFCRGTSSGVDQDAINQGFARDLVAVLRTLPPTLDLLAEFNEQPPLSIDMALDDLDQATRDIPRDRNDSLLQEEAARLICSTNFDGLELLKKTLRRSVMHNVINSKEGVVQALRQERIPVDPNRLLQAIEPTVEAVAQQLFERPTARRIRLERPRNRPVDIDANLLDQSW